MRTAKKIVELVVKDLSSYKFSN
uniref:Uncharacterized protein n=1 Tax=Arundo donax TaxID=35708 RepID=A0A0A8Z3D7_ARUDO